MCAVYVCVCVRGSFFFSYLMVGEEWQLSAGGSCHWKNSLLLSFLPWTESSSTHDFGRRLWEEKSSDAAKRYSAPQRTSNCNAALFFFFFLLQLIELCWRQDGAVEVEGRRLKLFLGVFFFFFFFCGSLSLLCNSLSLGPAVIPSLSGPLSVLTLVAEGN